LVAEDQSFKVVVALATDVLENRHGKFPLVILYFVFATLA